MRFEQAYEGWTQSRLTQEEATQLLGVYERTFRRYIDRYKDEGLSRHCQLFLRHCERRGAIQYRNSLLTFELPRRLLRRLLPMTEVGDKTKKRSRAQ